MEFVKILLSNSQLKEAKLYGAALKAKANPEIGVTINNKAAFHVIRDCADITVRYLPLYAFGSYQNPFVELKGQFTKKQIGEFLLSTQQDLTMKQLLDLILVKLKTDFPEKLEASKNTKIDFFDQMSDPYGDYGQDIKDTVLKQNDEHEVLNLLCEAFEVT